MDWGGLGIRRIKDVNFSLLCKWLWELGAGVIFDKYGHDMGAGSQKRALNHTVVCNGEVY